MKHKVDFDALSGPLIVATLIFCVAGLASVLVHNYQLAYTCWAAAFLCETAQTQRLLRMMSQRGHID